MAQDTPDPQMTVTDYRLGMHYGCCHGPVDALLAIYVNDKTAWEGEVTDATLTINDINLFGGRKKEGGLQGRVAVMNGGDDQIMSAEIAAKWGGSPSTVPGFRGLLTIFFMGLAGARPGFLWSTNTPYVKPASFKIRRMPKGLEGDAFIGEDANPAHVIYECLTNAVWGMGGSPGQMDVDSFLAGAETLRAEGFGLSLMWTGQTKIESFVQEVLDHIEATFFLHPRTGLLTLRLIRSDYDPEDLLTISPDNATMTNFQRKAFGETVNEINVTWTNPENEQEETVTVHDLGNIQAQGSLVSSSRSYYGIRDSSLALRVAARDLNASSFPMASCEVEIDRRAWDLTPGALAKVTWPEHQVVDLVMRVGSVQYGKPGVPRIRATLLEDVFAMPANPYVVPPDSGWVDPTQAPAALQHVYITDVSYYALARLTGDAAAEAVEYPQTYTTLLLVQNDLDTFEVDALAEGLDSGGTSGFWPIGTKNLSGRAETAEAVSAETETEMPSLANYFGKVGPDTGMLVQFGEGAAADVEVALVVSQGVSGPLLRRGVLDTVPRSWPSGTPIWFFSTVATIYDTTARAATQDVDYKFLTRTSLGLLEEDDAPTESFTVGARLHLPYRPANVEVNGVPFGPAAINFGDDLAFSWATRNRLLETSVILGWDESSVTPEAGQTTHLILVNEDGSVLYDADDLTGTEVTPALDPELITGAFVEYTLTSVRDGLESLQAVSGVIDLAGYGLNYGLYYGGV